MRTLFISIEMEIEGSTPISINASQPKKKRGKLLPAPIEQLTEFNVANYVKDLPCGLTVEQAAHNIPKYRSGLIQAVKRTREKETNYVELANDKLITAAKCDIYVSNS